MPEGELAAVLPVLALLGPPVNALSDPYRPKLGDARSCDLRRSSGSQM